MEHRDIEERDLARLYCVGKLSQEESLQFEAHFVDCPACLERLERLRSFRNGLKQATVEGRRRLSVDCSSGFAVFLEDNSPSPAIGEHETGLRRLGTALRSTVTGQRCSSEEFARGRTAGQRRNFLVEHIQRRTRLPRFFVSTGEPDCDFPGGPLGRLFSGGGLRTEAQGLSRHVKGCSRSPRLARKPASKASFFPLLLTR